MEQVLPSCQQAYEIAPRAHDSAGMIGRSIQHGLPTFNLGQSEDRASSCSAASTTLTRDFRYARSPVHGNPFAD